MKKNTLFSHKNAFYRQLSSVALVIPVQSLLLIYTSHPIFHQKLYSLLLLCAFVGDVYKIHHHITKCPDSAHLPRTFLITLFRCENMHRNPRDKKRFSAIHSSAHSSVIESFIQSLSHSFSH